MKCSSQTPLRKVFPSTQLPGEFLTLQPAYCIPVTTAPALFPTSHSPASRRRKRQLSLRLLLLLRAFLGPGASVMSVLLRESTPIPISHLPLFSGLSCSLKIWPSYSTVSSREFTEPLPAQPVHLSWSLNAGPCLKEWKENLQN